MELNDLKDLWANSAVVNAPLTKEEFANKLALAKKSKQRIKTAFLTESAIAVFIYILALIAIYLFKKDIYSFIYKLLIVVPIMSIPVFIRFYKSIEWMKRTDYTTDILQGTSNFVSHFKKTLNIYQFSTYASLVIIFVIFLTDKSFMALSFWIKCFLVLYLLFLVLATKPYLRRLYWKKINHLEDFVHPE